MRAKKWIGSSTAGGANRCYRKTIVLNVRNSGAGKRMISSRTPELRQGFPRSLTRFLTIRHILCDEFSERGILTLSDALRDIKPEVVCLLVL